MKDRRAAVPILLRQTSFKALEEPVLFAGEHKGTHTARFGEIEQRGVALTPKGRELYDRLLNQAGTGKDNLTIISFTCARSSAPSRTAKCSCAVRGWLISATV